MAIEWVARRLEIDVVREHDGELVARYRNHSASRAMDDRDRRAPIALARHAPVAQPVLDLPLAPAGLLAAADHLGRGLFGRQPVEELRIDGDPRLRLGLFADRLGG